MYIYILYSFPAGPGRDYTAGGYIDIYRTVRKRKTPSLLVVVYCICYNVIRIPVL